MKNKAHFLWIIPAVLIGLGAAGVITVAGLIATPAVRQKILNKGIEIASEKTGYDIELHRLYLSPLHQRPSTIFSDSVVIEIDTLFIGHANQDTLLYLDHLALSALPLAKDSTLSSIHLRDTIPVFRLALDNAVAHTDSLIEAVKIDANIGRLRTQSPGIVLDKGAFPLHGLHLADADVAITLNDTPEETEEDTTTTLMAFDVPDGRLDNFRFRLLPMGLDVATQSSSLSTAPRMFLSAATDHRSKPLSSSSIFEDFASRICIFVLSWSTSRQTSVTANFRSICKCR